MSAPVIAIVGRPNVGKSTLFNSLTKTRNSLVHDEPGVTRDRIFGEGRIGSYEQEYTVIDTGGISGIEIGMNAAMADQAFKAAVQSDIVFWVVDARSGLTPADEDIAAQLRNLDRPIIIVVNKIDGLNSDFVLSDFYSLGMGEPYPIAAAHRRGIVSLIDNVFEQYFKDYVDSYLNQIQLEKLELTEFDLESESESEDLENLKKSQEFDKQDYKIKVAVIGRPNVGKSTLINRLLGEARVVVYDEPGTTTDSIYIPFSREDRDYILIDTAGVRRRGRVTQVIEKFSIVKTLQAIKDANVVILLVDSSEQLTEQDLHLLGYGQEQGKSLIIACNKWDGLEEEQKERIKSELDRRLLHVDYAKKFFISAKHGTNVGNLWQSIIDCHDSAMQSVTTSKLTDLLEQAVAMCQPPLVHGRRIKLRYAHLGSHYPFLIVIHGKQTESIPESYRRYLAKFFQGRLKLVGTPVLIIFKTDNNPYAELRNTLTPRQQYKRDRVVRNRKSREK